MSRSEPKLENPCRKFIDYSGDEGIFTYYDKENKKKIEVPLPIYFTVLDELSTVTGFNEKHSCGIYSNEVHSVVKELLRVKTFKPAESITGLYKDIRDKVVAIGGKFTKSVYAIMINPDKTVEFCNFKFRGIAFSAWMDKKFDPMKSIVGITELEEGKKGKVTYQVPVFKPFKLTPEIDEEALEYDKILQAYLKEYFAKEPEAEIAHAEASNPLTDPIDPPLENKEGVWQGKSKKQELIDKEKNKGKQNVPAMSRIEDLPGSEEIPPENNEMDDLPF